MATTTPGTPDQSEEKDKSRKPKDTKFKQQKLPSWQPILTAGTVLPAFFAIGIAFIPLGVALYITSEGINEFTYDYTFCSSTANPSTTCAAELESIGANNTGHVCNCIVNITLDKDFESDVYIYYGLTNYFQNHRRYVRSRDDNQLHGDTVSTDSLNTDCKPYRVKDINSSYSLPIAPCGAIANSLFNDTFNLKYGDSETVSLLRTGIAWVSDKKEKFNNPSSWDGFTNPKNWNNKFVQDLDTDLGNTGYENEDLIVWMRTAALPTFRKLHRRVYHNGTFTNGLPKGTYTMEIGYSYPVTSFDGKKTFILSTTSWLGGKNPFLGIAYMVVGSICIVLGVIFLVIHIKYGKNQSHSLNSESSMDEVL